MTTSNNRDDDQEMSMDEILASIRRYVSSDEPIQKPDSKVNEPVVMSQPSVEDPYTTQRIEPRLDMQPRDEAIRVNEDPYEEVTETTWASEPLVVNVVVDLPQTESWPSYETPTQPVEEPSIPKQPLTELVSEKTLATTMESFARLREASASKLASKQESAPSAGLNQTLDQLFEGLARPVIRDWLDRNLPQMVERMVKQEIERITKL